MLSKHIDVVFHFTYTIHSLTVSRFSLVSLKLNAKWPNIRVEMLSLAQFHLNRLPHEGPTLTLIGCLSVVFAVWAFLFLELLRERITHSAVSSGKVKQSAVLVALIFTVVLGSVAGVNYRALATFRDSHFVALGRDVCRSWRFGSMLPDQPPAATLMGRY